MATGALEVLQGKDQGADARQDQCADALRKQGADALRKQGADALRKQGADALREQGADGQKHCGADAHQYQDADVLRVHGDGDDGRIHGDDARAHGDGRVHGDDARVHGDGRVHGDHARVHGDDGRVHGDGVRVHGDDAPLGLAVDALCDQHAQNGLVDWEKIHLQTGSGERSRRIGSLQNRQQECSSLNWNSPRVDIEGFECFVSEKPLGSIKTSCFSCQWWLVFQTCLKHIPTAVEGRG